MFLEKTKLDKIVIISLILVVFIFSLTYLINKIYFRKNITNNENCAMRGLKFFLNVQTDFYHQTEPSTYADNLEKMFSSCSQAGSDPIEIEPELATGKKCGYTFILAAGAMNETLQYLSWSATAWPIHYGNSGIRSFFIDGTGVIRGSDMGGKPGESNLPILENQDFEIFVFHSLRRIWKFQKEYFKKTGRYHKNLMDIWEYTNKTRGDRLDPYLAAGNKFGYNYHLMTDSISYKTWSATAWPISYGSTGFKSCFINETGKIRAGDINGLKGDDKLPIIENKANY